MKAATALLFALPLLALAQVHVKLLSAIAPADVLQSNSTNSSQALITSTSLSTIVTLGPNRQISTFTSTIVFVSTAAPTQSVSSNNTVSPNSTVSANSTASASRNSTSTSQSPLPTAPTTVAAGGGPAGAPFPGASGGAYGPDDKYIAAASTLARNTMLVGAGGLVLTGALMVIGTHNGTFHCDEALAVFLLRQTNKYRDADLIRTRDPAVLDTCNIVVDVGAVYDESIQRFDHHQRGFTEVFGHGFTTKLSSAGLVFKYVAPQTMHFGKEIIASVTQLSVDDEKVEKLWLKLYREFIEAIDAIDNGISQYPNDIKPKYRSRTDLSSRVGHLNPAWNHPADPKTVDALFAKASQLTGEEFLGRLNYYANAWLPVRHLLLSSITKSKETIDSTGKIILLEQFLPWKEHLFELEADTSSGIAKGEAIYIVYADETASNWRVQAVPVSPESFESRKALPEEWRGLRNEELSKASGIPGGIFIHASGFIGGKLPIFIMDVGSSQLICRQ
ncbi:hypothetical protein C0995_010043 [Termitomyces sp. Mi166|nr:hypothetical protein C0995_010043 [Termitomyces sp. Mi166\